MEKICRICTNLKDSNEFALNPSRYDGLNSSCKVCQRIYAKEHYAKNKAKYLKKAKRNNKVYTERNQQFICVYLLDHPCVDCGEDNILVLEFDHLRNKKFNVSAMITNHNLEKIKKEIKKCEVRCANCHKIKTHERLNSYKVRFMAD